MQRECASGSSRVLHCSGLGHILLESELVKGFHVVNSPTIIGNHRIQERTV